MKADARKLVEMARKGVPDKEIMKELGVQTRASMRKSIYMPHGQGDENPHYYRLVTGYQWPWRFMST